MWILDPLYPRQFGAEWDHSCAALRGLCVRFLPIDDFRRTDVNFVNFTDWLNGPANLPGCYLYRPNE